MHERHTVMVTAAGTIVAQGIIKSLRLARSGQRSAVAYRIVATDMSPQAAGLYRGDLGVVVPQASSDSYVDSIVRCCKRHGVDAVFCGSDEELPVLEAARERIASEGGATLIVNSVHVIKVGGDKWRTFEFLSRRGLGCADSALPADRERFVRKHGYPLVVKPRRGHGSLGFSVVTDRGDLLSAVEKIRKAGWEPMLQEYLRDEEQEFTVGVTSDRECRTLSVIAMRRKLKAGQTAKAFVEEYPEVKKQAEEVASALASVGPLNVQARIDEGTLKVFEVNPRFSASCPIRAVAGVNEPDILFRNWVLGERPRRRRVKELVALRYWNEVYLPRSEYERTTRRGSTSGARSFVPDYF
jgi:carbamoyl-phosphate synthase large subunit